MHKLKAYKVIYAEDNKIKERYFREKRNAEKVRKIKKGKIEDVHIELEGIVINMDAMD